MFRIRGKEDSPGVYRAIFNCGHLAKVSVLVSNLITDEKIVTDIKTWTLEVCTFSPLSVSHNKMAESSEL